MNEIPVLADADVVSKGRHGGPRFPRRSIRGHDRKPGNQLKGLAGTPYWTNREAVDAISAPPESLCVLGGGSVGVELAQGFVRAGTQVRIVESTEQLLPLEEPETAELFTAALLRQGVQVDTAATVRSVRHSGDLFTLDITKDTGVGVTGDAVGERVEVQRLLVPAHLSLSVGRAAEGTGRHDPAQRAVPRVSYTDPALGAVGLTEAEAHQWGLAVRVGLAWMSGPQQDRAGQADGFVKLVEDAAAGVLVGATVTGSLSTRMISELTTAVQAATATRRLAEFMDPGSPWCRSAIEDTLATLH